MKTALINIGTKKDTCPETKSQIIRSRMITRMGDRYYKIMMKRHKNNPEKVAKPEKPIVYSRCIESGKHDYCDKCKVRVVKE